MEPKDTRRLRARATGTSLYLISLILWKYIDLEWEFQNVLVFTRFFVMGLIVGTEISTLVSSLGWVSLVGSSPVEFEENAVLAA